MAEIQAQYCEKVYETSTVPHHIETSTVQRMSADLGANGLFKNGTLNGKAVSLVDTPESSITWTRLLVLFAGLALCVFLCSLDQTVVATAIPRIASDLGGLAHVAWIGSAYLLAAVAVTPLYGRLTGIFGIKQVFLSALFMFLIGSLGCGLSSSILMLIVFRIVAGIGGESIYALSLIIITTVVDPKRSAMLQGWFGAIFAVSATIGPLVGGVFTDQITWRWVFYINLPIGAVSFLIVLFGITTPSVTGSIKEKLRKIDYPGAVFLLASVITFLLAVSWGGNNTYAWDSATIITLFCVAVVTCGAFIWIEGWYAGQPFIPGRILKSRTVALTMLTVFISGWIMFSLVYYFPLFYQLVRGKSATDAGIMLIPLTVFSCITAGGATMFIGRNGAWSYPTAICLGFICTLVSLGLGLTFKEEEKLVAEIFIFLLAGLGIGLSGPPVFMAAQASCKLSDMPVSTMLCSFFQVMGGTIGLAITGSVFNSASEPYLSVTTVTASTTGTSIDGALENIQDLSGDTRDYVISGLVESFHALFISLMPVSALAIISSALIRPRRWSEVQTEVEPNGASH